MPTVDLDRVKLRLVEQPRIAARIARDFGLLEARTQPEVFANEVIASLGQAPGSVEPATFDASSVFRAAVRAIGSNSRSWSIFLRGEGELRRLLAGYDPSVVDKDPPESEELKGFLPGQTSTGDARAILTWASLLARTPDYYTNLVALRDACSRHVEQAEVVLVVASVLGFGLRQPRITLPPPPPALESWKTPGMGAVLCSEFLRNLRWSGFKPDRHIKRLFARWFPDVVEASHPRACELAQLAGSRARDLVEFLTFSLVGIAVTPPGRSYTEVDNLVWALGAYVETKGRESSTRYRME